jgi:hypothetical protein
MIKNQSKKMLSTLLLTAAFFVICAAVAPTAMMGQDANAQATTFCPRGSNCNIPADPCRPGTSCFDVRAGNALGKTVADIIIPGGEAGAKHLAEAFHSSSPQERQQAINQFIGDFAKQNLPGPNTITAIGNLPHPNAGRASGVRGQIGPTSTPDDIRSAAIQDICNGLKGPAKLLCFGHDLANNFNNAGNSNPTGSTPTPTSTSTSTPADNTGGTGQPGGAGSSSGNCNGATGFQGLLCATGFAR